MYPGSEVRKMLSYLPQLHKPIPVMRKTSDKYNWWISAKFPPVLLNPRCNLLVGRLVVDRVVDIVRERGLNQFPN